MPDSTGGVATICTGSSYGYLSTKYHLDVQLEIVVGPCYATAGTAPSNSNSNATDASTTEAVPATGNARQFSMATQQGGWTYLKLNILT